MILTGQIHQIKKIVMIYDFDRSDTSDLKNSDDI